MYKIIIKNGTIIDGTGAPMFRGDIGVKEDKIKEIGNLQNEKAERVIDARGKFVAPGFIDVNNHSDTFWQIFRSPQLKSLVSQGITTIIGGNCGSSLAPLANQEAIQSIQKWADTRKINLDWLGMEDFLNAVERLKLSLNFATLVGHGTLRRGIVPEGKREITPGDLKTAQKMLQTALKEGALGLSTGLVYTHAKQATGKEVEALAKTVAQQGAVYATHIRGEQADLSEAIGEALEVSRKTGVKLHISHFKAVGEKNWVHQEEALLLLEQARSNGQQISFDVYPYTATGSVLYTLLPDWASEGGRKLMLGRLKDPVLRKKVITEMKKNSFDYSKIIIGTSSVSRQLRRKKIVDLARFQEKSVEECIVDVLIASDGRVITTMESLSEENVEKALAHDLSIVASNGLGYDAEYKKNGDLVHPRNFGAFPRVLGRYVREKKVLSWEKAIFKMTAKPADIFGLKKRGVIKEGNWADLVVFDPETVADQATMEDPFQYSQGIEWVIVNGEVILQDGGYNGRRVGRVIRQKRTFFGRD